MDLNRITVFTRVVSEGSFTKAAKALGLPKSSVSRSVTLLEQELGTRLLQRSTRTLSLTEAGATYHDRVARALTGLEEANACATEAQSTPRGIVRMTAPGDAGKLVLMPAIARFVRKHPTIKVDLVLTGRIVDLVEEGFDLALRAGPLRDQTLIARKIAEIRPGLFASRGYVKRRGAPKDIADLANHDCVIFQGARVRSSWTLTGPNGTETVDVGGSIAVDDIPAVRSAVLHGAGIGVIPPFMGARHIDSGRIVRVLPDVVGPSALVSLVYPSSRLVPARVALLRDHLLEALARVPWGCVHHRGGAEASP